MAGGAAEGRCVGVRELPGAFRGVFQGRFRYFNALQSACFEPAYEGRGSLVVAAPTGSGKTALMELAILGLHREELAPGGERLVRAPGGRRKAIYIAPMKALVAEKATEWARSMGSGGIGLRLETLTSETDPDSQRRLPQADVILTTPEKFDAVTRRGAGRGSMGFFADIQLVIIDEVHILNDERGKSLEAVVARLRVVEEHFKREVEGGTVATPPVARLRFVAASATIPNARDVAAWLSADCSDGGDGLCVFGEELRPVPLETTVLGFPSPRKTWFFEKELNRNLLDVVQEYGGLRPTIVFCSSRKGAQEAAQAIADAAERRFGAAGLATRCANGAAQLHDAAQRVRDKKLGKLLTQGVSWHHAALDPGDRGLVEGLFRQGALVVLCSTSTLAFGVNLPAYLVVIRGTRQWQGAVEQWQEYDVATCMQMAGRAGRSQFDREARAVVMTEEVSAGRYRNLLAGLETVESSLLSHLPECLNAEVQLTTVKCMDSALSWFKRTFCFQRMVAHAGGTGGAAEAAAEAEARPRLLEALGRLREHGLLEAEDKETTTGTTAAGSPPLGESTLVLRPAFPGQLMSRFYLRLSTMEQLCRAPLHLSTQGLLGLLARSGELERIRLRRGEKKPLNRILANPATLHPPLGGDRRRIQATKEDWHKIQLLLNDALSDAPMDRLEMGLRNEIRELLAVSPRLVGAAAQYFLHRGAFAGGVNALILAKCIRLQMWQGSGQHCRQLSGVGRVISERLSGRGLGSIDALEEAEPGVIEAAAQARYPFGRNLKAELARWPPRMELDLQVTSFSGGTLRLELHLTRLTTSRTGGTGSKSATAADGHGGSSMTNVERKGTLVVGLTKTDEILLHEKVDFAELQPGVPLVRMFAARPPADAARMPGSHDEPDHLKVVAALVCDDVLGRDLNAVLRVSTAEMAAPLRAQRSVVAPETRSTDLGPGGRGGPEPSSPLLTTETREDDVAPTVPWGGAPTLGVPLSQKWEPPPFQSFRFTASSKRPRVPTAAIGNTAGWALKRLQTKRTGHNLLELPARVVPPGATGDRRARLPTAAGPPAPAAAAAAPPPRRAPLSALTFLDA